MWAQFACAVAEFDADDHQAGGGEIVTPADVTDVGGAAERHAAAVDVDDARRLPRSLPLGRLMYSVMSFPSSPRIVVVSFVTASATGAIRANASRTSTRLLLPL